MKLYICGAANLGKSSLSHRLRMIDKFRRYTFVDEIGYAEIQQHINGTGYTTEELQILLYDKYMCEWYGSKYKDNYVFDRSIFDVVAYSRWNHLPCQVPLELESIMLDDANSVYVLMRIPDEATYKRNHISERRLPYNYEREAFVDGYLYNKLKNSRHFIEAPFTTFSLRNDAIIDKLLTI